MDHTPYYLAYEKRYRKVYEAGVDYWGHPPEDKSLLMALSEWVNENRLTKKRIIEFACGEGASGLIFSTLGCIYHGVDIAPSAIAKATKSFSGLLNATLSLHDMVEQKVDGTYDAALDVMGFHMLITDRDRKKYLGNVAHCLKKGAPFLLFRQSHRDDAYEGNVTSFDDGLRFLAEIIPRRKKDVFEAKLNRWKCPSHSFPREQKLKRDMKGSFIARDSL